MDDQYVRSLFDREPWPHQIKGVVDTAALLQSSTDPIVLTSPTGGGKSAQMMALIRWAVDKNKKVALYTNRNMLLEQTMGVLDDHQIDFGVRGAQFPEYKSLDSPVQLCSIQTEISQTIHKSKRDLHQAHLVLIDEAHLMKNGGALNIIAEHRKHGARIVGVTATPLGMSHVYKHLVVAGLTTELFQCGALVPALVYAPEQMDVRKLKTQSNGEFSLQEIRKKVWTTAIMDFVYDRWRIINPDARPALGFAPGVRESIWFASQFHARGVRAAHIDGEEVWVDGRYYQSDRVARNAVLDEWKDGRIKVMWNRFVMREGIDVPQCYHLILATPIGSLLSYIQVVGRVMRKSPQTPDHVLISDHSGCYWLHGSPNENRDWQYLFNIPVREITMARLHRLSNKTEREPMVCEECGCVRRAGNYCQICGHRSSVSVRYVLQLDGSLKRVVGDVISAKRRVLREDTQKLWDKMFWGSHHSKSKQARTFYQLEACFYLKHRYYPPRNLIHMPLDDADWAKKVRDVPLDYLIKMKES